MLQISEMAASQFLFGSQFNYLLNPFKRGSFFEVGNCFKIMFRTFIYPASSDIEWHRKLCLLET